MKKVISKKKENMSETESEKRVDGLTKAQVELAIQTRQENLRKIRDNWDKNPEESKGKLSETNEEIGHFQKLLKQF